MCGIQKCLKNVYLNLVLKSHPRLFTLIPSRAPFLNCQFRLCRAVTSFSGSHVNFEAEWHRRLIWCSFVCHVSYGNTCGLLFFQIFSLSFSSPPLSVLLSLSSHLIGHTGNGSDSFLRKLHPLPVCIPPHLPPSPVFFFFLSVLREQLLKEWRSSSASRNPPVTLMRLWPDERAR